MDIEFYVAEEDKWENLPHMKQEGTKCEVVFMDGKILAKNSYKIESKRLSNNNVELIGHITCTYGVEIYISSINNKKSRNMIVTKKN